MYGDYEFLCIMYGLTGANGKFCGLDSVIILLHDKDVRQRSLFINVATSNHKKKNNCHIKTAKMY